MTGTQWLRATRAGGFCESLLALSNRTGPWPDEPPFIGGRPGKVEPGAVTTAGFIIFLGLYELLLAKHSLPVARYLNVLIILNGVSSLINHANHHVYFDFLDGATMIFAVNLSAAVWFETMIELVWPQWCGCCTPSVGPSVRTVCIGLSWLLVCAVMTPLGMTSVTPFGGMFEIPGGIVLLFNLPILAMVITAAAMLHCGTRHLVSATAHVRRKATALTEGAPLTKLSPSPSPGRTPDGTIVVARRYLWAGVASYLFGFICWNVVEKGCKGMPDGFRAIGHAFWHLGAAYGLHCLFCLLILFRSALDARRSDGRWRFHFRSSPSKCLCIWLVILPVPEVLEDALVTHTGCESSELATVAIA